MSVWGRGLVCDQTQIPAVLQLREHRERVVNGQNTINHLDFSFVTVSGDTASQTYHDVHSFFMPRLP